MTLPTTSNVNRPRSQGYDIDIDGTLFRLVPSPDNPSSVVTKELEIIDPDSPGGRAGAGESPEFTQFHFSNGEGLQWAHSFDADAFDIHRFWRSKDLRIDLSFEEDHGSFSISPDFTSILSRTTAYGGADLSNKLTYTNDILMVVDAGAPWNLLLYDDPLTSSTATQEEPSGGASLHIRELTSVNNSAYVVLNDLGNDHIKKRDVAASGSGTWSTIADINDFSATNLDGIWGVQGRLLVAADDSLWEMDTDGTTFKELITLANPPATADFTFFTDVTDAGHAVLVSSVDGHVYAFGADEGELALKAQTPFSGEEVLSIEHSKGFVLVATRRSPTGATSLTARLYTAQLGGDYTLQNVNLIREWDVPNVRNQALSFITSTQNDFYFMVDNEYWRYNLRTQGLFQYKAGSGQGTNGLLTINDRIFRANGEGALFREDDPATTFDGDVNDKYVISPVIHFNSHEPKVWSYITVEANLRAAEDLFVQFSTDPSDLDGHGSWDQMTLSSDGEGRNQYTIHAKDNAGFPDPSRHLVVKLSVGDNTENPRIYNWTVAASPTHTFQLPVLISDEVRRPGRKPVTVPGLGEDIYEKLYDLDETSTQSPRTLKFHKTGDEYIGMVSRVAFQEIDNPEYGGATTIGLVEFKGRKVAGT